RPPRKRGSRATRRMLARRAISEAKGSDADRLGKLPCPMSQIEHGMVLDRLLRHPFQDRIAGISARVVQQRHNLPPVPALESRISSLQGLIVLGAPEGEIRVVLDSLPQVAARSVRELVATEPGMVGDHGTHCGEKSDGCDYAAELPGLP